MRVETSGVTSVSLQAAGKAQEEAAGAQQQQIVPQLIPEAWQATRRMRVDCDPPRIAGRTRQAYSSSRAAQNEDASP